MRGLLPWLGCIIVCIGTCLPWASIRTGGTIRTRGTTIRTSGRTVQMAGFDSTASILGVTLPGSCVAIASVISGVLMTVSKGKSRALPAMLIIYGAMHVAFMAVALASRIGRVQRFPRARSLANYWGLTPGCRNSGESAQRLGRITKAGSGMARWLLAQLVFKVLRKDRALRQHRINTSPDLTLNQELPPSEIDDERVVDLVLEAGQMSLHDVFLVHGSEPNRSNKPRRGMTLRFMPTTSVFDRALAVEQARSKSLMLGHEDRTLYLMRGTDRSGKNDFRMRR